MDKPLLWRYRSSSYMLDTLGIIVLVVGVKVYLLTTPHPTETVVGVVAWLGIAAGLIVAGAWRRSRILRPTPEEAKAEAERRAARPDAVGLMLERRRAAQAEAREDDA